VPLDKEAILRSVEKTGRLVIVTEDVTTCGVGAEIAAIVAEEGLFNLDAPIKRVCVPDTPIPFAPVMESQVIPDENNIIEAVKSIMK
jgi:pyruvate dehydrogenase E1 component beta subunit